MLLARGGGGLAAAACGAACPTVRGAAALCVATRGFAARGAGPLTTCGWDGGSDRCNPQACAIDGPAVNPTTAPATAPTGPSTIAPDTAPSAASAARSCACAAAGASRSMATMATRSLVMLHLPGAP